MHILTCRNSYHLNDILYAAPIQINTCINNNLELNSSIKKIHDNEITVITGYLIMCNKKRFGSHTLRNSQWNYKGNFVVCVILILPCSLVHCSGKVSATLWMYRSRKKQDLSCNSINTVRYRLDLFPGHFNLKSNTKQNADSHPTFHLRNLYMSLHCLHFTLYKSPIYSFYSNCGT